MARRARAAAHSCAEKESGGDEAANEPTYVNCLLTTLGRGTAPSVTLIEGEPLPDPSQLTSDPHDLDWIARMNFALDRLSSAAVIRPILHFAGYRWFRFGKSEGHREAGESRRRIVHGCVVPQRSA